MEKRLERGRQVVLRLAGEPKPMEAPGNVVSFSNPPEPWDALTILCVEAGARRSIAEGMPHCSWNKVVNQIKKGNSYFYGKRVGPHPDSFASPEPWLLALPA